MTTTPEYLKMKLTAAPQTLHKYIKFFFYYSWITDETLLKQRNIHNKNEEKRQNFLINKGISEQKRWQKLCRFISKTLSSYFNGFFAILQTFRLGVKYLRYVLYVAVGTKTVRRDDKFIFS
jgi:hypothetical protein